MKNPTPTREQEWTVEGKSVLMSIEDNDDRHYFHCTNERNAEVAVIAHNAALAAERQSKNLMTADALNLKKELAAEREKREQAEHKLKLIGDIEVCETALETEAEKQLREQLAVLTRENDGRDESEAEYAAKMVAEIQARDKQLDTAVEALKNIAQIAPDDQAAIADAALAKINEKNAPRPR